jgi:hypothetical protein
MRLFELNARLHAADKCDNYAVGSLKQSGSIFLIAGKTEFHGMIRGFVQKPSLLIKKKYNTIEGGPNVAKTLFDMSKVQFGQSISTVGGGTPDNVTCDQEGLSRTEPYRPFMIFYQWSNMCNVNEKCFWLRSK